MQKVYGGLVSNPVNKMDTYRGSAVTRTTSGAVVDGDVPIGEEYEMPFYMKVTYEGDGENPVNILTKNISRFGSFTLDELYISKMTIDGKELSFKDLTVINRCPPNLGGVCNIYTYVFGDTNDHILTIYAKKDIRNLMFAPWTSGPEVVDDACFSKIKKVEYYVASYILEYSFYKAANLSSVKVSNKIISIGTQAFKNCASLSSFTIPSSVVNIGSNAFLGCYFSYDSFVNNSTLSDTNNWGAVLVDTDTEDGLLIKNNSLIGCRPWATSITIPNSVTSIADRACREKTNLTSVTIPNSVTSIGVYVFDGCSGLTSITVEAATPPTLGGAAIPGNVTNIYVPAASVDTYKAASGWSTYSAKIQAIPEE